MNRELKFRAFDNVDYMSNPFTIYDVQSRSVQITHDAIVMQYTGLKDKNGKEIYEGDIITCHTEYERSNDEYDFEENPIEVSFDNRSASFFPLNLNNRWRCDLVNIEVVGNIYENPDLLK